ncbi:hypothetical protein [Streptomyces sp. NPDC102283]|uniref:hypothetical protein n=1 Tax=Streptomyces sp. NPDC102283 TaxID=3366155 RepID=UPI0037FFDF0E
MDGGTLVATVSGVFIAVSGTVLADRLRQRHEKDRGAQERRRAVYIEFIAAAGRCHTRLRGIAQAQGPAVDPDLPARAAFDEAAVHEVRERFFIDASADVAGAGQAMFQQLRPVQRVVGTGATHHLTGLPRRLPPLFRHGVGLPGGGARRTEGPDLLARVLRVGRLGRQGTVPGVPGKLTTGA